MFRVFVYRFFQKTTCIYVRFDSYGQCSSLQDFQKSVFVANLYANWNLHFVARIAFDRFSLFRRSWLQRRCSARFFSLTKFFVCKWWVLFLFDFNKRRTPGCWTSWCSRICFIKTQIRIIFWQFSLVCQYCEITSMLFFIIIIIDYKRLAATCSTW